MNGEQYNFNFEHPKKHLPHEIMAGHESLLGESTEQLHSKLVALEQQIATHRRSSDTDSANELEEYAAIIRAAIQFKIKEPLEKT
jgi:hypothetical protein